MSRLSIEQAITLAMQHHRQGQLAQAEGLYRQILAADPNQPDALQLLGLILSSYKRFDEAIDHIARACAMHPEVSQYPYNLAQVYESAGRQQEAMEAYQKAVAAQPGFFEAHHNLGAIAMKLGRVDVAIAAYRATCALRPNVGECHRLLSHALFEAGRIDEAMVEVDKAAALQPDAPEIHNSTGATLEAAGRFEDAIRSYRKALALRPSYHAARYNLGMLNLLQGNLVDGYADYEARWQVGPPLPPMPVFRQPLWDGSPLDGQRILLWPEQGFGDMIQYVRYTRMVIDRGGRVVIAAPVELEALMRSVQGIEKVVGGLKADPTIDVHAPLMSLPRIFKTTVETIPASIPYLFADPSRSARWRGKIPQSPGLLKIGLAWAGRPTHKNDALRSLPLSLLAPLARVPNAWFISLQKGEAAQQVRSLPNGFTVHDVSGEIHDFADTAALIEQLDRVIAVDTAVAHLAGAMGKPVMLLLAYRPDWRWMLGRDDSPWYPSMRLFRQTTPVDWSGPIAQLVRFLSIR